jgi:hypothetical protein
MVELSADVATFREYNVFEDDYCYDVATTFRGSPISWECGDSGSLGTSSAGVEPTIVTSVSLKKIPSKCQIAEAGDKTFCTLSYEKGILHFIFLNDEVILKNMNTDIPDINFVNREFLNFIEFVKCGYKNPIYLSEQYVGDLCLNFRGKEYNTDLDIWHLDEDREYTNCTYWDEEDVQLFITHSDTLYSLVKE